MAVKPETRFQRRVNEKLIPEVHRQRITNMYGNGTPDYWYSGSKADAWVEYKWLPKVSRNGVDPLQLLSSLQTRWINDRYREGRLVMVIIGSPVGCVILEDGLWNHRVLPERFGLPIPAISAILSERLHDATKIARSGSISDQPDVQSANHFSADRRNSC